MDKCLKEKVKKAMEVLGYQFRSEDTDGTAWFARDREGFHLLWEEYEVLAVNHAIEQEKLKDQILEILCRDGELYLKCLYIEPGKAPRTAMIASNLNAFQRAVGGSIQIMYPWSDSVYLMCNDEGKVTGLPLNRSLRDDDNEIYDIIAGPMVLLAEFEGKSRSLTDAEVDTYQEQFWSPEKFYKFDGKIDSYRMPVKVRKGELTVYQLDTDQEEGVWRLFLDFEYLRRAGKEVDPGLYRKVYESECSMDGSLEDIYIYLNAEKPFDLYGHSLSVSDVIVVRRSEDAPYEAWYVDSVGFRRLEDSFVLAKEV